MSQTRSEIGVTAGWLTGVVVSLALCVMGGTAWIVAAQQKAPPAATGAGDQAEVAFQVAHAKQVVEGKLDEAIKLYRDVVAKFPANKSVAARALVAIGQCYEKLGSGQVAEARKAYEQIVSQYADQLDAVGQARTRLAKLASPAAVPEGAARFRLTLGPASGSVDLPSSISTDGRYLARSSKSGRVIAIDDIVIGRSREIDLGDKTESAAGVTSIAFSPDGNHVAYDWRSGSSPVQVRIVPTTGGTPRVMAERATMGWWSSDGRDVHVFPLPTAGTSASSEEFPSAVVAVADGAIRPGPSIHLDRLTTTSTLRRSPDGRYVTYTRYDNYTRKDLVAGRTPPSTTVVAVTELATGGEVRLTAGDHLEQDPVWTPDGNGIVFARGAGAVTTLWTIHIKSGQPIGNPTLVHTFPVESQGSPNSGVITPLGVTADGALHYLKRADLGRRYVVAVDANHHVASESALTELPSDNGYAWGWSPDGRFTAMTRRSSVDAPTGVSGGADRIAIRPVSGGAERVIAVGLQGMMRPRWSPDGRSILVVGHQDDTWGIFSVDVLTGVAKLLVPHPKWTGSIEIQVPFADWSPDGKAILFGRQSKSGMELVFRDIATGQDTVRYTNPAMMFWPGQTSIGPDGSAYLLGNMSGANNSSSRVVLAVPPSDGQPRVVFQSKAPNTAPAATVSADGKGVWVSRRTPTAEEPDLHELIWVPVDGGDPVPSGLTAVGLQGVFPSPDGTKLLLIRNGYAQQLWTLEDFLPKAAQTPKR